MKRKAISLIVLILLLTSMLSSAFDIQPVKAEPGTIYIRADGSVDPPTAPIQRDGNIYTFTANINDSIVVERSNIIVDGNGYTLQGSESGTGIDLTGRSNVTIQSTDIKSFGDGIMLYSSSNISISGNTIANNTAGVWLWSSFNNSISGNNITNNGNGISLQSSFYNSISGNNITAHYWEGVKLSFSSNNTVSSNNITNNDIGVYLYGSSLYGSSNYNNISGNTFTNDGLVVDNSYLNSVEDNTVNGKHLVYLEGVANYSVGDAGQVILVNCDSIRIEGLNLSRTDFGVELWGTTNSIISRNNIANNMYGVWLWSSFNNSISGNNITANNMGGVHFDSSYNNSISGSNIANNWYGIGLRSSFNNSISGNNITANNMGGIYFSHSSSNTVSGNVFVGDGLLVYDSSYENVVENNTLNSKPLVYLEGASNQTVAEAGQVILVRCDSIRVESLNLSHTAVGIELFNTNNTLIGGSNITANNRYGVWLWSSFNNSISGNNIANNRYGVYLRESSDNIIYYNNFDNTQHVYSLASKNIWDYGYPSGGNYWSDYSDVDVKSGPSQDLPGSDGIGDDEYTIDGENRDRYPLMAPINTFDAGTWNATAYNVDVVSNSTVSHFYFNPEEDAFLRFNVTGADGTTGFCRVTILNDLLWVEDGWTITVGDQPITDYTLIPDENYTYLYFTYNHSTKTIVIQGTHVILEFPQTLILPLFMIISLVAVVFAKKTRYRKTKT